MRCALGRWVVVVIIGLWACDDAGPPGSASVEHAALSASPAWCDDHTLSFVWVLPVDDVRARTVGFRIDIYDLDSGVLLETLEAPSTAVSDVVPVAIPRSYDGIDTRVVLTLRDELGQERSYERVLEPGFVDTLPRRASPAYVRSEVLEPDPVARAKALTLGETP